MSGHYPGSYLCGGVRVRLEADFERFYLCHCVYCRKDTGSAHAANLFASTARLTWLSGQEQLRSFKLPATRHTRSFCAVCGSALPSASDERVVIPAGCLDSELEKQPDARIFFASRAAWECGIAGIPTCEGFPPS